MEASEQQAASHAKMVQAIHEALQRFDEEFSEKLEASRSHAWCEPVSGNESRNSPILLQRFPQRSIYAHCQLPDLRAQGHGRLPGGSRCAYLGGVLLRHTA